MTRALHHVVLVAAVVLLGAAACGKSRAGGAEGAAERFLDLYFVEIDQAAAREVTSGVARETIERELADVASVRAGGYLPSEAKSRTFYARAWTGPVVDGSARFVYDVTIERDDDRLHRHVLVTVREEAGVWKVATFTVRDGKMLRPAGSP